MDIDLSLLHSKNVEEIKLDENVEIPSTYYENSDIISLSKVNVVGKVIEKENDDFEDGDYFIGTIKGTMTLQDSISLEEVLYPFSIDYDDFIPENCIKSKNLLDIFLFLWENTVLEVPLQFTKVRDLSKFHGDGWRLISEEELIHENNPFSELLKDFEEE